MFFCGGNPIDLFQASVGSAFDVHDEPDHPMSLHSSITSISAGHSFQLCRQLEPFWRRLSGSPASAAFALDGVIVRAARRNPESREADEGTHPINLQSSITSILSGHSFQLCTQHTITSHFFGSCPCSTKFLLSYSISIATSCHFPGATSLLA